MFEVLFRLLIMSFYAACGAVFAVFVSALWSRITARVFHLFIIWDHFLLLLERSLHVRNASRSPKALGWIEVGAA